MVNVSNERAFRACELRGFGVAFGDQVVLASIDLAVPRRGLVCLLGPAGTGKSTLLRTLAGLNAAQPALRTWGTALYDDAPLGDRHPTLVHQNARLLMSTVRENLVCGLPDRSALTQPEQTERILQLLHRLGIEDALAGRLGAQAMGLSLADQRQLAVARGALGQESLVLIDEPTAGLDEPSADAVLRLIGNVARDRAVMMVTHNQAHAKRAGGRVALLAGGRIQETRRTKSFFDTPASTPARAFVASGRCGLPGPMARREDLSPSSPPPPPLPPEAHTVSAAVGPRNFHWLEPGKLGGLPRPGIIADLTTDLEGLRRLSVTHLVNLEERLSVPESKIREHGIEPIHFPVDDMRAPEMIAAVNCSANVEALIDGGSVVAMHCRAGMGRTGTMLTCQLIWNGMGPVEALELARGINPRWVQSEEQLEFLRDFHRWTTRPHRRGADEG